MKTLDAREHILVPIWFEPECGPQFMEWRPATQFDALTIAECGGPLIDHDTGQVMIEATLRPEAWIVLAGLPKGTNPYPVGSAAPPEPAAPAPKPSTLDAFAMALAA